MSLIRDAAIEDEAAEIATNPDTTATIQDARRERMNIPKRCAGGPPPLARPDMRASCQFGGQKYEAISDGCKVNSATVSPQADSAGS
jgi:hypothetical protein